MDVSAQERRQAFSHWLRTGRLLIVEAPGGVELKFNPYHDPRNGQFTFAPGGAGASTDSGYAPPAGAKSPSAIATSGTRANGGSIIKDGVASGVPSANQARPPSRPSTVGSRGSNSRAFEDPMTLEQALPGLRNAPAGAILAAVDNLLDLKGPADEAQSVLLDNWSRQIINQIKAIDPSWHHQRLGPIVTIEGKVRELAELRWQRAGVIARIKSDYRPLQVETLRFVQQRANSAYEIGAALMREGKLTSGMPDPVTLGNYIDREVRRDLRAQYSSLGIDSSGKGPVRVNRRENSTNAGLTYRRPDARVDDVAFDVTLERKTPKSAQVKGFFTTDFQPRVTVIIRPRQVGPGHTYAIPRPETKQ